MILTPEIKSDIYHFFTKIDRWYRTRGPVWTAKTVKLCRLAVTRYLCGAPLSTPAGIGLTKAGLPKVINHHLRDLVLAGNPRGISLVLTLLSVTRVILGGTPVDVAAIENPSSSDITKVTPFIEEFLVHYNIKKIDTDWKEFHWSTKMGPSGPALVAALGSWRGLPADLKAWLETLGGAELTRLNQTYESWPTRLWDGMIKLFPCRFPNRFRKLSVKPDREAKSRVFAMLDYFSQTVLVPLHLGLFQGLKQIPSDRTFVQAEGLNLDSPSGSYHSLDLSSATDRFPLALQQELLAHLIGKEKAEAWARILTHYPYDLQGKTVLYGTGQPMGAYSSWAAFTMSHHLVVFAAARLAGKPASWDNYRLLGDDIVIADDSVAEKYRYLLQTLDVPVSEQKTHVSKDTFEFAKRWWHKGVEVTPFPFHGLMECVKKHHLLLELLRSIELKGFENSMFSFRKPGQLLSLLWIHGIVGRYARKYVWRFHLAACIPLAGSDPEQVYISAKRFVQLSGVSLSCNHRFASVVHIFERFAATTVSWMLARESERLVMEQQRWTLSIGDALVKMTEGSGDQPEALMSLFSSNIVVLETLGNKATAALDSISDVTMTAFVKDTIWNKMSRLKLMTMPPTEGINPTRASHQIAGARSAWALNLVQTWKRHEQGLRPSKT